MEFSTGAVERNKCGFVNPFREMDYSHRDAAYRARRLQNRTPPGGNLAMGTSPILHLPEFFQFALAPRYLLLLFINANSLLYVLQLRFSHFTAYAPQLRSLAIPCTTLAVR